jgi:hypothetical protein
MTLTFNDRFHMVTAVTYRPGYATLHGSGKRIELASGSHSLGGSTGVRYWLLRPGPKLSWEMRSALGLVFGGSPVYEDLFESSTVSLEAAAPVVIRSGPSLPGIGEMTGNSPLSAEQKTCRRLTRMGTDRSATVVVP